MSYKNFEELLIWQEAFNIVKLVYSITKDDKIKNDFRLID